MYLFGQPLGGGVTALINGYRLKKWFIAFSPKRDAHGITTLNPLLAPKGPLCGKGGDYSITRVKDLMSNLH